MSEPVESGLLKPGHKVEVGRTFEEPGWWLLHRHTVVYPGGPCGDCGDWSCSVEVSGSVNTPKYRNGFFQ